MLQVKWLKKLYTALYADDGFLFFDEDSGDVTFCSDEIGILSVNFDSVNFDNNFDNDDPDTTIFVRFLVWHSKSRKRKAQTQRKMQRKR